ncbi:MAG: STAS domain-containing protein [Eubacterium sp.]|nr:STAS domain-containing protein [Eubacterium sp.]
MTIVKNIQGDQMTIKLSGRLDTVTSPQLESEVGADLDNVKNLVWDLQDLEYISSSGLRILLAVQKRMNKQGSMKMIHVNETIMDIFDITGFTGILTIE